MVIRNRDVGDEQPEGVKPGYVRHHLDGFINAKRFYELDIERGYNMAWDSQRAQSEALERIAVALEFMVMDRKAQLRDRIDGLERVSKGAEYGYEREAAHHAHLERLRVMRFWAFAFEDGVTREVGSDAG